MKVVFRLLVVTATVVLIVGVLAVRTGITQSPPVRIVPFTAIGDSGTDDWQSTMLEIVYTGPANKLLPSIALTGERIDPFAGHKAMKGALPNGIPPVGNRLDFRLPVEQLRAVVKSVSSFGGTARRDSVLGLYAIQMTTGRVASLELGKMNAPRALGALTEAVVQAQARQALQRFDAMTFPVRPSPQR